MLPSGHDPVITVMSSEQLQLSALDLHKTEPVSNLSWERRSPWKAIGYLQRLGKGVFVSSCVAANEPAYCAPVDSSISTVA